LKRWVSFAASAAILVATPAFATTTFAQYEQLNNNDTVSFTAPGSLTNTAGAVVSFNYVDAMPAGLDDPMDAYMTFAATGAPYSGTLTFLRVSDNANLLTVVFSGAALTGLGTAASFLDSQPTGTVTYTSDFLDFSGTTAADFALSFSALTSPFGGDAWTADSTGTFAANIPEPATWAMMILGFGATGALVRLRRRRSPAVG
jgi:hypothetical protein